MNGLQYGTPRQHLFDVLGIGPAKAWGALTEAGVLPVGKGGLLWLSENPARLATSAEGDARVITSVKQAAAHARLKWRETNYLLLRRGPYLVAAGLDESIAAEPKVLRGRLVNLLDPDLRVNEQVALSPGSRLLLLDLDALRGRRPQVLASACKALPAHGDARSLSWMVEGVPDTRAVVLLRVPGQPKRITLAGQPVADGQYSTADHLLWVRFTNTAAPRELALAF
jgi:hypothetical protein